MSRPELVLIAAIAERNRVIGKDGELPWYLSEDLKRFKRLTIGHAVLMGRKTFESIVARLGKPLRERRNMILSKNKSYSQFPDVEVYDSLETALDAAAAESIIFAIGGETIFEKTLPLADRLELTMVEGVYEGDAFFPEYERLVHEHFRLVNREPHEGYRFETYRRIG